MKAGMVLHKHVVCQQIHVELFFSGKLYQLVLQRQSRKQFSVQKVIQIQITLTSQLYSSSLLNPAMNFFAAALVIAYAAVQNVSPPLRSHLSHLFVCAFLGPLTRQSARGPSRPQSSSLSMSQSFGKFWGKDELNEMKTSAWAQLGSFNRVTIPIYAKNADFLAKNDF